MLFLNQKEAGWTDYVLTPALQPEVQLRQALIKQPRPNVMLAVIAQLNDYDKHHPYDYRDGIEPEKIELTSWPIYNDDELDQLKYRLSMVCDDALSEGIRAIFTIVKVAGVPASLHYDFPYQPVMGDLFDPDVDVFTNGKKTLPSIRTVY